MVFSRVWLFTTLVLFSVTKVKTLHYGVCEQGHYLMSGWINLAFFLLVLLVGPGVHRQSLLPPMKSETHKVMFLGTNVDLFFFFCSKI